MAAAGIAKGGPAGRREPSAHADSYGPAGSSALCREDPHRKVDVARLIRVGAPNRAAPGAPPVCSTQEACTRTPAPRTAQREPSTRPGQQAPPPAPPVERYPRSAAPVCDQGAAASYRAFRAAASAAAASFEPRLQSADGRRFTAAPSHVPAAFNPQLAESGGTPFKISELVRLRMFVLRFHGEAFRGVAVSLTSYDLEACMFCCFNKSSRLSSLGMMLIHHCCADPPCCQPEALSYGDIC